jgi:hypothetical protein
MRILSDGYRGLSLILERNTDRLLFPALIVAALGITGWLVSLMAGI